VATEWPPEPYRRAIRSTVAITYTVDASRAGVAVAGATGLRPTGGGVTDTSRPGVRRTLNLELAGGTDLYELLAPTGTMLTVTANVVYTSRQAQAVPMGVFDVDADTLSEGNGAVSLTAPDKWARIQRAQFLKPQASSRGALVVDQITALIRGALGASETVNVTATSTATVGALTWDRDRAEAINQLAKQIGAWVYFDREGTATVADLPVIGMSADWLIDASASGVLIELDREQSRADAYNVVVVDSSAASGAKFTPQMAWDSDPASPTYAGTNPLTNPSSAGPFGIVPYFYSSPILTSGTMALRAARTTLARVVGLASQVSLTAVPNPAIDAGQVIDVLPPGTGRAIERHIADTVSHPFAGGTQRIEGRSTRTEDYT
jgi:hypothetical protein